MKLNYESPIVVVISFAETVKLDDGISGDGEDIPVVTTPDDIFDW